MSTKKLYTVLWWITGLAAVGLVVATLVIATRAHNLPVTGLEGSVTSLNPTIYLREGPSGSSKIVTILEKGNSVLVTDVATNAGTSWLKIESGRFTGWLPAANVAFEQP